MVLGCERLYVLKNIVIIINYVLIKLITFFLGFMFYFIKCNIPPREPRRRESQISSIAPTKSSALNRKTTNQIPALNNAIQ